MSKDATPRHGRARIDSPGATAMLGGMPRYPKCHACGKWMPVDATACPHCDAPRNDGLRLLASLMPRSGAGRTDGDDLDLTPFLLGVVGVLFILPVMVVVKGGGGLGNALLGGADGVAAVLGAVFRHRASDSVLDGEYWRFVTANFMHFGLMHLAFNGLSLMQLVPARQAVYGPGLTLALFVGTGICGFVAAYALAPARGLVVAGASASLFGLIGVGVGDAWRAREWQRLRSDLIWVAGCTLMGLFLPMSHAAHGGGLVAGIAFGYVFPEHLVRRWLARSRAGTIAGGVALLAVLASFALAARAYGAA